MLDVVPLRAEDLIDDIGAHLVLAALGLWDVVVGLSSPGPRGLVVIRGLILVHPQLDNTKQTSACHPPRHSLNSAPGRWEQRSVAPTGHTGHTYNVSATTS